MRRPYALISIFIVFALVLTGVFMSGCVTTQQPEHPPALNQTPELTPVITSPSPSGPVNPGGAREKIVLATTTSLYDTGILEYLKPKFEAQYPVDLLITSQGTGQAIELAKRGDADILAVHSPAQEIAFMEGGYGINRRCFANNYFIIIGPENDPAGVKGMTPEDAFGRIRTLGLNNTPGIFFVSRGDNSGTHAAEKAIWKNAGFNYTANVQKSGQWYIEAGSGMGATLLLASNKQGYTLTDEGTFLAFKEKTDLISLVKEGASLLNVYSVITTYNTKQSPQKIEMANHFVDFMISPGTQDEIAKFGKEKYGKSLFSPMQGNCARFSCDCSAPANLTRPAVAA
jgi:tungstate transport system substrate-binding protein